MYLHQKLRYTRIFNLEEFESLLLSKRPSIIGYDTEATGLNVMVDKPFLIGLGFDKYVFVSTLTKELFDMLFNLPFEFGLWAHNAKYDYHMMINGGFPIPEHVKLFDSLALARLTQYADDIDGIGLESLGKKYVDPDSKFAGKVIKNHINEINKERLRFLKVQLKQQKLPANLSEVMDAYRNRVQFVEHPWEDLFFQMDMLYQEPNYKDSWEANPNLMENYLCDDIVIMLEFIRKAMPVLHKTGGNMQIFEQENKLIRIVGDMERVGLKVDVDYLLKSRVKVMEYKDILYKKLAELTGITFSAGQHEVIKEFFRTKFGIKMVSADLKALTLISKGDIADAKTIADIIIELRSIDKWLSTYIEGKLNKVHNGRVHPNINNEGTITGRVASDFQQEPQAPLLDMEGNELFHPRRVVLADEGGKIYYFDYSQMELRLQAQYTIDIAGGDSNLCRAFIPFKCSNIFTGKFFRTGIDDWRAPEWVDENGELWTPTDLHSVTTLKAFPELGSKDHPEFKHYRRLGKMCNFLKNYGGGIEAIRSQIIDDFEIANKLNQGYYAAFPKILDYQKWVEDKLTQNGYIENIYGRRYYIRSSNYFYKGYNYEIQGGCADMVKDKQIRVGTLLKGFKSKMLLPVHDEIQVFIYDDEKHLIDEIEAIMQDTKERVKDIPMVCDIEFTATTWADKIDYKVEEE